MTGREAPHSGGLSRPVPGVLINGRPRIIRRACPAPGGLSGRPGVSGWPTATHRSLPFTLFLLIVESCGGTDVAAGDAGATCTIDGGDLEALADSFPDRGDEHATHCLSAENAPGARWAISRRSGAIRRDSDSGRTPTLTRQRHRPPHPHRRRPPARASVRSIRCEALS